MKKTAIIIIFMFSFIGMKAQVFQEWTARYNGVDSLSDQATAIDAHGCIYVTGITQQFNQTYNRYENHIVILRYNQTGATLWAVVDTNIDASESAIVTDNNCNIYLTGSRNINGNVDFYTSKYDSAGVKQWEAFYDDPQHNYDAANSIAIDNTGSNIYVAGNSAAGTTLVKYSLSGVQQWVANYNVNNGMGSPQVFAIAIDAGNNIYMTGVRTTSNSLGDYLTLKYNSNGVQQWVTFYNGPGNGSDIAYDIATDKNDNIYVTGASNDVNNKTDYATIKYNKNGIQQWVARYDDSGNGYDNAISIAIDGKGNIDVFGTFNSSNTGSGYATLQYNKNGVVKWIQLYNGPTSSTIATAMALDTAGNVYVTGYSEGIGTFLDYATIKYLQKGDLAWVMRYNGTAGGYDYATAIAVDAKANVYVTGASQETGTGFDMVTVKYVNIPKVIKKVTLLNGRLIFASRAQFEKVMDTLNLYGNDYLNSFEQYFPGYNSLRKKYINLGLDTSDIFDAQFFSILDSDNIVQIDGRIYKIDLTQQKIFIIPDGDENKIPYFSRGIDIQDTIISTDLSDDFAWELNFKNKKEKGCGEHGGPAYHMDASIGYMNGITSYRITGSSYYHAYGLWFRLGVKISHEYYKTTGITGWYEISPSSTDRLETHCTYKYKRKCKLYYGPYNFNAIYLAYSSYNEVFYYDTRSLSQYNINPTMIIGAGRDGKSHICYPPDLNYGY
jgi:hypothetical protein